MGVHVVLSCTRRQPVLQTVALMPHFGLNQGTAAQLLTAAVGGARDRNRTGTLFQARDFKSLVSTYFTTRASVCCCFSIAACISWSGHQESNLDL